MTKRGGALTRPERELVEQIAARAASLTESNRQSDRWRNLFDSLLSGLAVCHLQVVELDLEGLSKATMYDIAHDVYGIRKNLDNNKKVLSGCFLPRHAKNR